MHCPLECPDGCTESELTELEFVHDVAVGGADMGDDNGAKEYHPTHEARGLTVCHA